MRDLIRSTRNDIERTLFDAGRRYRDHDPELARFIKDVPNACAIYMIHTHECTGTRVTVPVGNSSTTKEIDRTYGIAEREWADIERKGEAHLQCLAFLTD